MDISTGSSRCGPSCLAGDCHAGSLLKGFITICCSRVISCWLVAIAFTSSTLLRKPIGLLLLLFFQLRLYYYG